MGKEMKATEIIAAVRCARCGKLHVADSKDYVNFYGDVIVGLDEPILSNTDGKGKVATSTVYCRSQECLGYLWGQLLPDGDGFNVTNVRGEG